MHTEKFTARRLTSEEVSELGLQEEIFVSAELDDLSLDCFAPAFLTKPGKYFDGGSFTARTIFGKEIHVLPNNAEERGIWVADEAGEEIEVLQSAGVLLNLALFVPNGNKESLESLYTAARKRSARESSSAGTRKSRRCRTSRSTCSKSRPAVGRARAARTATAAPWTSTPPEYGSWSPAPAGSSSSNRTTSPSTTHLRSESTAARRTHADGFYLSPPDFSTQPDPIGTGRDEAGRWCRRPAPRDPHRLRSFFAYAPIRRAGLVREQGAPTA